MTPAQFWSDLYTSFSAFLRYMFIDLIPSIISMFYEYPILLLVFGFFAAGFVVNVFGRLND